MSRTESKRLVVGLLAWTVIVLAGAIIIGSPQATPDCAHLISPPSSCATEIAAENARVWSTRTLPLLLVAAGGYVAVILAGLTAGRRRARVTRRAD